MDNLKHMPSLEACKRVLAELYNTHANMSLELRIKILTALGYADAMPLVGALFSGQASLNAEGVIEYHEAEAEAEEYPRSRLKRRLIEPNE